MSWDSLSRETETLTHLKQWNVSHYDMLHLWQYLPFVKTWCIVCKWKLPQGQTRRALGKVKDLPNHRLLHSFRQRKGINFSQLQSNHTSLLFVWLFFPKRRCQAFCYELFFLASSFNLLPHRADTDTLLTQSDLLFSYLPYWQLGYIPGVCLRYLVDWQ